MPTQPRDADDRRTSVLAQIHIIDALHRALTRWPEVSHIAFDSAGVAETVDRLRQLLEIDEVQASAILDMQVRRLPLEQRERIASHLAELRDELRGLEGS